MSMKPGATIRPAASNDLRAIGMSDFSGRCDFGDAFAVQQNVSRSIGLRSGVENAAVLNQKHERIPWAVCGFSFESRVRAFRGANHQKIQNSHAHRDAVGDLFEHSGARAIGDIGSNFRAAIDGSGMKNQSVGLGEFHAFGVELIEQDVIVLREGRLVEAFGLHAKNDDDVGVFESFFDAIDAANGSARRADVFEFTGNPHRGAAQA